MASVVPPSDQAADLLQKLSLDSQTKTLEVPDPTKKPSATQLANGISKPFERSTTPLHQDFVDPNMCYLPGGYPSTGYYYGGYDGQGNEWEDYSRYLNPDGVEMSHGVYGDNGSVMYHNGYGYAPYGTYPPPGSPVPTMGHDGQLYGPQQYQYPTSYYPTPTSGPFTPSQVNAHQVEVLTSVAADQVPLSVETAKGNPNGGSLNGNNGQSKHAANAGIASPISHANNLPSGRNQNLRPLPHLMGLHNARPTSGMGQASGYMNRMYPNNKIYGQCGNTFRTGCFGSMGYDSRTSGRGWLAVDSKYKPKGRGYGFFGYSNENMDGLNELNRGPRAKGFKNQKGFGPITLAVKGQNLPLFENNNEDKLPQIPDKEQYNREDFPENYSDAKFFVIKSYSEDDVHKSIKYSVWASTPNGNKKLDAAYQEAQGKPGDCPIFLLFSVNTSGQFVGLAEMVGPVDFNKSVEYWQQDKWNGCFSVKWHIIKDVPNSLLKHITLENNENKPVTNSRDTQEVKFEQGSQLLKIFKGYSSKTCILDDFEFYEARQRTIQEKKAKQQQFQKQVWDGKPSNGGLSDEKDKDGLTGTQRFQKSLDTAPPALIKEAAVKVNGEVKVLEENGSAASAVDGAPKPGGVLSEKRVVSNGVATAC